MRWKIFLAFFNVVSLFTIGALEPSRVERNFHGVPVKDPYYSLEKMNSPETIEWLQEQAAITDAYFINTEFRQSIKQHITELGNYPRYSIPIKCGSSLFFTRQLPSE